MQIFSPAGNIPLRQLVYRVLDLPPSMRPLVYDFGQLNTDTESDYIRQIVSDHVSVCSCKEIMPVPRDMGTYTTALTQCPREAKSYYV